LLLYDTPSDISNWNAFRSGDREAFEYLFRSYYPLLVQYGTKICPEKEKVDDCIHDLFIELWQSKTQSPVLSVKAYLLKALKYKLFRQLRITQSNFRLEGTGEGPFEFSHDHFIVSREEEQHRSKRVIEAVTKLPGRQKEIIYLRIYQQLSYEEISEVMGINYQVARNLFSQSLRSLRVELGGRG
jgi:RNA polymerase sigma factor (sigma-70 family)